MVLLKRQHGKWNFISWEWKQSTRESKSISEETARLIFFGRISLVDGLISAHKASGYIIYSRKALLQPWATTETKQLIVYARLPSADSCFDPSSSIFRSQYSQNLQSMQYNCILCGQNPRQFYSYEATMVQHCKDPIHSTSVQSIIF